MRTSLKLLVVLAFLAGVVGVLNLSGVRVMWLSDQSNAEVLSWVGVFLGVVALLSGALGMMGGMSKKRSRRPSRK